jgi:squalene-hopene/tetraprenyl-beta-curcumene cyclase
MTPLSVRPRVLPAFLVVGFLSITAFATLAQESVSWDMKGAAAYMDSRQIWWRSWPNAARDANTVCVSCHTALPYALARPALRSALNEHDRSENEATLIADVVKRVRTWREVEPWYPDQTRGLPKTAESRGTESVINALVLSRRDAADGGLSADTRQAFANLWAQQMRTGDLSGAWAWLSFRLEPWEGAQSPYWGAVLAAIAVGTAPDGYASSADIQPNLTLLRGYLTKELEKQHTLNRLTLLWASARLSGLLTSSERDAIVAEAFSKQQPDGGWSLASLGPWQRRDGTVLDKASDGYATGLATFTLQQAGLAPTEPRVKKGLQWLAANQQRATGRWLTSSLNKQHDPESDAAKFMDDVATAYAVLALTAPR